MPEAVSGDARIGSVSHDHTIWQVFAQPAIGKQVLLPGRDASSITHRKSTAPSRYPHRARGSATQRRTRASRNPRAGSREREGELRRFDGPAIRCASRALSSKPRNRSTQGAKSASKPSARILARSAAASASLAEPVVVRRPRTEPAQSHRAGASDGSTASMLTHKNMGVPTTRRAWRSRACVCAASTSCLRMVPLGSSVSSIERSRAETSVPSKPMMKQFSTNLVDGDRRAFREGMGMKSR